MNIEEADIEKTFLSVQNCLEVVHFADSNRRGVGRGHLGFRPVVAGMKAIGFDKTIASNVARQVLTRSEPTRAIRLRKISMPRNRSLS